MDLLAYKMNKNNQLANIRRQILQLSIDLAFQCIGWRVHTKIWKLSSLTWEHGPKEKSYGHNKVMLWGDEEHILYTPRRMHRCGPVVRWFWVGISSYRGLLHSGALEKGLLRVVLGGGHFRWIVSIASITPEVPIQIRKNGKFEVTRTAQKYLSRIWR